MVRQYEQSGGACATAFTDQLRPRTIDAPILTIHGDQDDIAPYNQAMRLHAALEKAGAPNQFVTLPGRKHGGFNRQDLVNSYAVIREFLRKHNLLNAEQ